MSNICRLCLQSDSEKYYRMDTDDYRYKMQSVIPEIDIEIVEQPFICLNCSEFLLSAYSFKSNCLHTDEELKRYSKDDGRRIKLEEFLRQNNQDLLYNVKIETSEYCVQERRLEADVSEKKGEDNYNLGEVTFVDILQITNNLQEDADIETDIHEINVSKTLIDKESEKKTTGEKVAEICKQTPNTNKYRVNKCLICKKVFLRKSALDIHLRRHNHERAAENGGTIYTQNPKILVNKCLICKKVFLRKSGLEAHLTRHKHDKVPENDIQNSKIQVHKCEICKKVFFRKSGLDGHLKRHDRYKCTVCNKFTPCKASLEEHMRVHTGERPFQCTDCGKAFAQKSTLYTHVRSVHMSERPFICEICGMGFAIRGAYTAHKRLRHNELEKTFVCKFCGKAYIINSRLERHMKCHTGEKNYLCQVCSKRFVDNASLKKHLRIHNGDKPYECPICQKTFTQNYNMKIHLKSCARRNGQTVDTKLIIKSCK